MSPFFLGRVTDDGDFARAMRQRRWWQGKPAYRLLRTGCIFLATWADLSETAFGHSQPDGFRLRWFTPKVEVDLCGHATLASAHVLWHEGQVRPNEIIRFHTRSGVLQAARAGEQIDLDFPLTPEEPVAAPPGLADALGAALKYVGKSRFDYLVEVDSEATLGRLAPNFPLLATLPIRGLIVTSQSSRSEFDFSLLRVPASTKTL